MAEGEKLQAKMEKLEKQYNSLQVLSTITKLGTKEVYSRSSILRSWRSSSRNAIAPLCDLFRAVPSYLRRLRGMAVLFAANSQR